MLPEEMEGEAVSLAIMPMAMGGSLGAVNYDRGYRRCSVWMMKDYGVKESWTRLYRIDSEGFQRVIGFRGSGEAILAENRYESLLVTYNPETMGIKHVENSGANDSFYVDDYNESLVLLGDSWEELVLE
ncbi:hypothetical protein ACS0TY_020991 [Phlomoides rotata]